MPGRASTLQGGRQGRLLERDAELAAVRAAVADAAAGEGRLLLVEGPAGIGKTRLVAAARAAAREAGFAVVSARGSEMERDFPFGVVRQLFEGALADAGRAERLLTGSAAAARPVVAPLGVAEAGEGDSSFAMLHGLYWLCVNLTAEGPLCLAVDDLHWCDRPSLRFLAYLVRRLEGLPLLVAGSLRPAEPGADRAVLAELAADPACLPLRPAPLSPAATAALIGDRLGQEPADAFSASCHRATGGNPLLLDELLAALAAQDVAPDAAHAPAMLREVGPRAVARAVRVRLDRLAPDDVAVARAAAVLGDGADVARVAELAGLPVRAAAAATGRLARAEILRPDPPISFVHPLVRAAVYHDLAPGERERQHARAAVLLRDAGAPLEQVAAHLLATPPGGEGWVVDVLEHAARTAMSRGAADSAAAYLRRAMAEPPPAARRVELGFALGSAQSCVSGPEAIPPLRAAYEAAADPVLRARIALRLAEVSYLAAEPLEAARITAEAQRGLGPADRDLWMHLEAWRLTVAYLAPNEVPVLTEEECRRLLPAEDGPGARALAGVIAYQWAFSGGRADDVMPAALHATGGGILRGPEAPGAPVMGAVIVLILADREEGFAATAELLDTAHRRGSLLIGTGAQLFRGLALALRGELEEAERLIGDAVAGHMAWGTRSVEMFYGSYMAHVQIARGEVAAAERTLHGVGLPPDELLPTSSTTALWLHARLRMLVAAGRHDDAVRLAAECERRFPGHVPNPAWIPWRSLAAESLHALGRREEAVASAMAEVPHARRWGAPRVLGRSLRVAGSVAGDPELLEEAVELTAPSPARLEHAECLCALGTHLRLARRPREAREPLRRALELATVCGARPLADRARTEIHATGARPRTDALSGVAALTASERRVAGLALEGATNKDIAQALYVTPKTVEVHLSSAYRKLGIRSRRELAGVLASA